MDITLNKKDITALACEGCKKKFISNIYHNSKTTKSYIDTKLVQISEKDSPAIWKDSGMEGERDILVALAQSGKRIVSVDTSSTGHFASLYKYSSIPGKIVEINSGNAGSFKSESADEVGGCLEYNTDVDPTNAKKLVDVAKSGVDYIYQFVFLPTFTDISGLLDTSKKAIYKSHNIQFTHQKPDLVKIISPNIEKRVLGDNYSLEYNDGNKYILEVADVKSAEFNRSFFFELSLYMALLKGWLNRSGLDIFFDVSYSAKIISYDVLKSNIRDVWNMDFALTYQKFKQVFNDDIIKCIDIIEGSKVKDFLDVEVSASCQVCDYYGGQYEGELKKRLDKISSSEYEKYIYDPNNHFCKYYLDSIDDINVIPSLRTSDVRYLKNKHICDLSTLGISMKTPTGISDNIGLLSNSMKIIKEIGVHKKGLVEAKRTDTNLLSAAWPDLQFYVLIRQDSQGRTLSYGVAYSILVNDVDMNSISKSMNFSGPDSAGNYQLIENNMSAPYWVLLDDDSPETQLVETIDFIEAIYLIREKYKNVKHNVARGKQVTYGFFYWGEKNFKAFKKSLNEVIKYLTVPGNTIDSLYTQYALKKGKTYTFADINRIKKHFDNAMRCFSDIFNDEKVTYYDRIKNSPLFDLKYIYEELIAVDTNYSYNIIDVYNCVINPTPPAFNYKYRPDSDNYSLYTYDKWWSNWKKTSPKSREFGILKRFDELHLVYLSQLREWLYKSPVGKRINKRGEASVLGKYKSKGGIKTPQLQYIYLYQKLNKEYDRFEIESIHTATREKKEYGGEAIYLERLLSASELTKLGIVLNRSQRAYLVSKDSVNANIDENAFALTFFPENRFEETYRRIFNNAKYIIYMDPTRVSLEKWMDGRSYRDVVQCKIVDFNRNNRIIIIQLTDVVRDIINELENTYGFDFSKSIVIENAFSDVWTGRLRNTINFIETKPDKLAMIMSPMLSTVNSATNYVIESTLKGSVGKAPLELDASQINAIREMYNNSITVLWGPPGTGKSHTLSHSIIHRLILNKTKFKVLLLGNYNATNNILENVAECINKYALPLSLTNQVQIVRISARGRILDPIVWSSAVTATDWNAGEPVVAFSKPFVICSATPEQMARFTEDAFGELLPDADRFDLIIVDEASQMDVTHFLPALLKADNSTQIVIAGDDKQLQPIRKEQIKPDDNCWFGSIYDYYNYYLKNNFSKNSVDLQISRRSNECILNYIKETFDYNMALKSDSSIAKKKVSYNNTKYSSPLLADILCPDYGVVLATYEDGISTKCNNFEVDKTVEIVKELYQLEISNGTGMFDFKDFFEKRIGVVVPHRVQKAVIQKRLYDYFSTVTIKGGYIPPTNNDLNALICSAVDTVDRFQGRERDVIIANYVLGNEDAISEEQEFIYDTHRLNVVVSRAKWKVIVIASNELMDNLSNDLEVLDMQKAFQKLKVYCDSCVKTITDPTWNKGKLYMKKI